MPDWNFDDEENWTRFEFKCTEDGTCLQILGYRNGEDRSTISQYSSLGPPFDISIDKVVETGFILAKLLKSLQDGLLSETLVKIVPIYPTVGLGYPRILGLLEPNYQWRQDPNDWHSSIREALEKGCPVKTWNRYNNVVETGSVVLYATAQTDPDNPSGLPEPPALPSLTSGAITAYDYFKIKENVDQYFPGWHRIENFDEPESASQHTFVLTVKFGVRQSVSFIEHNTPELANSLLYHYRVVDTQDDEELAFPFPLNEEQAQNNQVVHSSVYITHGADAVHENRIQIPVGTSTPLWSNDRVNFSLDQPTSELPLIVGINKLAGYPMWNMKISRSNATNRRQVNSQFIQNPEHIRSLFGEDQSLEGTSIHTSFSSLLIIDPLGNFNLTVFPSEYKGATTPEAAWNAIKSDVGDWGSAWLLKGVTYARARIQIPSEATPSTIDINKSGDGFFQGDLLHFLDATTKEVIGEASVSADAANSVVPLSENNLPELPVNTEVWVEHLGETRTLRFLNIYRSHNASGIGWTVQITPGGGNVLQPETL